MKKTTDDLDEFEKLVFASPTGAQYCPRTSFTFIPNLDQDPGKATESHEFVHEQFHHISSMLLGAGFFSSAIRYSRSRHLRTLVLNYEQPRDEIDLDDPLKGRFSVTPIKLSTLGEVLDDRNDSVPPILFEVGKLKLAERIFLHLSTILPHLERFNIHPAGIILEAGLSSAKEFNHRFGHQPYWMDEFETSSQRLVNNILKDYSLPYVKRYNRCIDTYDLFEAFSVCADISMTYQMVSPISAQKRFESLASSEYLIVIDAIFGRLGLEMSAQRIAEYTPTVMLLLEWALDSDFGPLTSWMVEDIGWEDIYPPARLGKALRVIEESTLLKEPADPTQIAEMHHLLASEFNRSSSWVRSILTPSFFEIMKFMGKERDIDSPQAEYRSICAAEYYQKLYLDFQRYKAQGNLGVTHGFYSGTMHDFEYVRSPIVFSDNGQILTSKNSIGEDIFGPAYTIFSNFLTMDDYVFGKRHIQLFPFDATGFRGDEWYKPQLGLFVKQLEDMKKEHSDSRVHRPHPFFQS